MSNATCLLCGKELLLLDKQTVIRKNRKFCNRICRARYNSRKNYQKLKDDPKFKAERKEYHKQWVEKNRAHWNELSKNNMKKMNSFGNNKNNDESERFINNNN